MRITDMGILRMNFSWPALTGRKDVITGILKNEWITYTPGLNLPLVFAIELFTDPGDNVIIQSPVYYPYYDYVNKTGRHIVYNALVNKDGYYEMNFEQLEMQAKDPKSKTDPGMQPSKSKWTPLDKRGADPHGKYLY